MRRADVKMIVEYYCAIPARIRLLERERAELEEEYGGLSAAPMDGLPHGSAPGKPTEDLAARAEARRVRGRLEAVGVRLRVLEADREKIRDCLDVINGEYARMLLRHYRDGYSWVRISVLTGTPERTVRRRCGRALERLGEALEDTPMAEELLGRASRARG